jgi:predicted DNA-binding transcriptional regulator AlpA
MAQSIQRDPAFLRRKQVETRTGLSRSTIYQYMRDGVFPKSPCRSVRARSAGSNRT